MGHSRRGVQFLPIQEAITAETAKWGLRGAIGAGIGGALLGGIGAGPAAIAGGKAGAVAGAAKEGFRMESASALMDYEDAGMDSGVAWWAATAYGVIASFIEGGTEFFAGLPILFGASPSQSLAVPAKQAAKLTVKKAIFDFAKNFGKMKVGESVEEGLQQFAQNVVGEAGKALSNMNPDWSIENLGEGVIDSVMQTLWSAVGAEHPTIRLGVDLADVRATRAAEQRIALRDQILAEIQGGEQAILEQLDGFSQESQLAKLDPLLYEDALRHLAQGSPIKTVYIPAQGITDAYADNTAKLNETLDALGVAKEDYQLALESGGDLLVPVEKYASTVAVNAEFVARISGHRRLTEDGFTVNELQDWQAAQRDEMQRLMEAAQSEEIVATQTERESQEIFWAVRQQLEAAGQPQDVARANAAQMAAFFATLSSRSGQYSPRQLWDMYAPDVRQGENGKVIEAGEALTPVGESKTPQFNGKGSALFHAAMYRGRDATLYEFLDRIREEGKTPRNKSYFLLGSVNREDIGASNANLELTSDNAHHVFDRHPNYTAWNEILDVVSSGEAHVSSETSGVTDAQSFIFLKEKGEKGHIVVASLAKTKKGQRLILTTAFEDTIPQLHDWIQKKTNATVRPQSAYKLSVPDSLGVPSGHTSGVVDKTIAPLGDDDNTLHSKNLFGAANTPRGSITLGTPSGRPLVTLFEQADASTFLHESGHLYLEMLRSLALAENAPPEIAALWAQAKHALGITDDTISTEQHEVWASSLEDYFLHGEAPSMELRGVFDQFKAWLKAIYNAFRSLGAKPQKELHAVFDRLFATDQQMAEVEAWHEAQKPLVAGLEGMVEKARESARDARLRRLTKAYLKALGGRKKFVEDARKEADALPVYAAMKEARSLGMDSAGVEAVFGAETRKALAKKRLLRKDGENPEILAARHGYASAEAMLVEMMDAEGKNVWIRRTADKAEQLERVRLELGLEAANSVPGDAEYHNDERLALLLAEWQGLQKTRGERKRDVTVAAARQVAKDSVAGTSVSALHPHKHAVAERRAGRKAAEAAAKGDAAAAAMWKQREVLAHALYMETRDAKDAVDSGITGHGWTQDQLDAVLDHLEKRHWDFVQGIWNYIGTYREPSFALHRELNGREPTAVQAEPVQTKFGTYEGGYYPIVYDKDAGFKAWERAMKDMGESLFGGTSHGTMQTRRGHLNERAKGGTGERLSDDLNVIVKHVFDVAHDITHRRAVMDVAKLLRDKEIGEALETYLGPELRRAFKPWLQNIARETNEQYIWSSSLMRKARNAVTLYYLGFKLSSMLAQLGDFFSAIVQKGEGRNTVRGLGMLYGNPLALPERLRSIREKSAFMAGRMENFDREFRDSVHGLRLVEGASGKVKKASMKGIEWMQYALDAPVWLGAYESELARTGDEGRAVAVADSTVRLTFGSGSAKDLASIQRGGEFQKLITMFYTPFSAHYNLLARRVNQGRKQGWRGVPGLAWYAFVMWVVSPVVTNLVTGRGPDDGEDWGAWALHLALREPFNVLPVARDIVGAVGTGFDYEFTPAGAAVNSGIKFGEAVYKAIADDDYDRLGKRTAEFAGMMSGGMITSQHIITIGNVWDYMADNTDDFELRDLFFRRQKSRR
ncbi:hypothetical protein [Desulfovibrio falkowii]|uniref:hypothetical protein n=1 Tax=Desulfovibrio falkowii TaxID=3136602 RepID=UPI0038B38CED